MRFILSIPVILYSIWAYLVLALMLVFGAVGYALVTTLHRGRPERAMLRVNNVIAVIWGFFCGMRYKVRVPPAFDWKKPAIYVVNHTSTLDMLICSYAFRMGMRFLAKKELQSIPFMGYMFSRISVFVDRGSEESRKAALDKMKSLAADGVSLCVFPEGTRNRGESPVSEFYEGAFRMAIYAGLPVVPLVITNARNLMPMKSWTMRPGVIYATYLEPVPTVNLTSNDVSALRDHIYEKMYNEVIAREPQFSHLQSLDNAPVLSILN